MATGGIRVYADTSVFGGIGDDEFAEASLAFLEAGRMGRHLLVSSPVVRQELGPAPETIRAFFTDMMLYDGVNMANGYAPLGIHTPRAVIDYGTQEEEV